MPRSGRAGKPPEVRVRAFEVAAARVGADGAAAAMPSPGHGEAAPKVLLTGGELTADRPVAVTTFPCFDVVHMRFAAPGRGAPVRVICRRRIGAGDWRRVPAAQGGPTRCFSLGGARPRPCPGPGGDHRERLPAKPPRVDRRPRGRQSPAVAVFAQL